MEGFADNAPEGGWLRRYSHLPGAPGGCLTCEIFVKLKCKPQYYKHTEAGGGVWISSEFTSQPYHPSVIPVGRKGLLSRMGWIGYYLPLCLEHPSLLLLPV